MKWYKSEGWKAFFRSGAFVNTGICVVSHDHIEPGARGWVTLLMFMIINVCANYGWRQYKEESPDALS